MKKLLNNPWVVGALAIAAVAFVAHSLIPAGAAGNGTSVSSDTAQASETDPAAGTGEPDVREAIKDLSAGTVSRDPFAPRAKTAPAVAATSEKVSAPDISETIRLTALWTQNGSTYALINNRVCGVGDKVGNLVLDAATKDGVWVTHWKGRDFVAVGAEFTLTTPALKAASLSRSTDS